MKINNNITTLLAAVTLLTACGDDIDRVYTVGEAENTLILRAGVSEDGAGVVTRAGDENHSKHVAFTSGTQIALRVDGTWTGHSPSSDIKQKTVATLGDASNQHNALSTYNPVLFWDDYGTADPANKETGRAQGLTIYGAAVDGKTSLPTTLSGLDITQSTWTSLAWQVCTDDEPAEDNGTNIIDQTGGYVDYDLVTSNNVAPANDNAYKFADRSAGKLLEFTHAMTKITVQLTAGEGFPRTNEANAETAQFEAAPSVTLEGFYYKGIVNVETKTSTYSSTSDKANFKMHGGAAAHIATFDALVFPGNTFANTDQILTLTADGNTYKVTAEKLNAAIDAAIASTDISYPATSGDHALKQAWNYLLKIKVNKTDLDITATILDWKTVIAEEEAPKINVTSTYGYTVAQGGTGVSFTNDYDLFRSTAKSTGYDEDNDSSNGIQYAARYASSSWDKAIYWPDHQTHYFFRGVYPQVGTAVSGTTALTTAEAVTTVSSNDVIAVANSTYTTATYPSDLAIAIPRNTDGTYDETCKETGHIATEGICATEGVINMNFEYAMSKVEVRLKSSATDASHIAMTKDNTKIEIIGGNSKARIKLSDGLHDTYADADKGDYSLSNLTTPATDFLVTSLDAIVPQVIGNDVIFRVTVITNDKGNPDPTDDETDVYECKVNLINVKNSSPATPVTEWEHGKHYIYELDVNKTAINVTATLKDWVEVEAEDTVWF